MLQPKTPHLYDKHLAVIFYQNRYSQGYMDEWPIEKKLRIYEVICSFKLPDVGEVLDFGCGNGIFTAVLKRALPPGWKVYGTDISNIAIENAKKRHPECIFFLADDREFKGKKFLFLFTHHVLEHVYNLPQVLEEISNRLEDKSIMLHILPCGNEDSFEHSLCRLRDDGINRQLENRFFFEDEGHVRRLTTEHLDKLCKERGFALDKEYYGNQYYGAIDWITQSDPSFLRLLTDTAHAVDEEAKSKLKKMRRKLFFLWCLRYPTTFVESKLHKKIRTVRDSVLLIVAMPLYMFSKPIDDYLKGKALNEWKQRKTDRNGSEMYLFFKR